MPTIDHEYMDKCMRKAIKRLGAGYNAQNQFIRASDRAHTSYYANGPFWGVVVKNMRIPYAERMKEYPAHLRGSESEIHARDNNYRDPGFLVVSEDASKLSEEEKALYDKCF